MGDFPYWKILLYSLLFAVLAGAVLYSLKVNPAIWLQLPAQIFIWPQILYLMGKSMKIADYTELGPGDPVYDCLDPELTKEGMRVFAVSENDLQKPKMPFFGGKAIFFRPRTLVELPASAQAWLLQVLYLQNVPQNRNLAFAALGLTLPALGMIIRAYQFPFKSPLFSAWVLSSLIPMFIAICLVRFPSKRRAKKWVQAQEDKATAETALAFLESYAKKNGYLNSQSPWVPSEIRKLRKWTRERPGGPS